jgi:hypothetical protein
VRFWLSLVFPMLRQISWALTGARRMHATAPANLGKSIDLSGLTNAMDVLLCSFMP